MKTLFKIRQTLHDETYETKKAARMPPEARTPGNATPPLPVYVGRSLRKQPALLLAALMASTALTTCPRGITPGLPARSLGYST